LHTGLSSDVIMRAVLGMLTAGATLLYRLLTRDSSGSFFGV